MFLLYEKEDIYMAINSKDFIPRPGFVNKQGCLPDPVEITCIQVPKVFDQCLIKECLKPTDDCEQLCKQIPNITDPAQVRCVGCCKDLKVKVNSVTKCPVSNGKPGHKKVTINFTVTFDVDVDVEINGVIHTETLNFSVNRTITASNLYCPDTIAKTIIGKECTSAEEIDQQFIKLEVVGECLSTDISKIDCDNDCCSCSCTCEDTGDKKVFLCITLGLFIIIKCEIVVQLMVPAYGYCPVPEECKCSHDPCKEFMERELPALYPPQEMDNLFDDYDERQDERHIHDREHIEEEERGNLVTSSIITSN
ncbi:TPA: exosporium protein CsxA [Clostridium botulinum]|nr:exosporium protein CsxA [Clostridium sporogenes]EKO1914451.1 exosporium protein CsxA [Clostridium botulinum]EKO2044493.1 exosporium protein CsxA [Clostridium botulinum]MCW6112348.1 exosporium protein CsxA [Clostridium sporogenes]HBJ2613596.1 exosporium protein CsxA [Clostridium botulinum]